MIITLKHLGDPWWVVHNMHEATEARVIASGPTRDWCEGYISALSDTRAGELLPAEAVEAGPVIAQAKHERVNNGC